MVGYGDWSPGSMHLRQIREILMSDYHSNSFLSSDLVEQPVTVKSGTVFGRLIGGNLSVFAASIGTPYFPRIEKDTILFLEGTPAD